MIGLRLGAWAALLLLLLASLPSRASGQQDTPAAAPAEAAPRDTVESRAARARGGLTVTAGVERRHDDNILRMTPSELDQFAADPTSSRYRIASPAANVSIVRGDVEWRGRLLPRRQTTLDASADAYAFERNHVKD